ncbi:MAG: response regulator [Candidatus Rokuibacteriota bacterium]
MADFSRFRDALKGLSVLVVDDEPDALELAGLLFDYAGARVTIAATARDALRALTEEWADLLVTDLAMPGDDGFRLIREVRRLRAGRGGEIRIVAFSAMDASDLRLRALAEGADVHVSKPCAPDLLLRIVQDLLRGPEHGRVA